MKTATADEYVLYGDLEHRDTIALATILRAKGVSFEFVPESRSLSLVLAARSGNESGPYLRTPEGFVLSGLHSMLEWLEYVRSEVRLVPDRPIRRSCLRLVEDWIELWLVHWPRRSWGSLERLGQHYADTGFLLGREPVRADYLLAAWLEADVLTRDHARAHLSQHAPRLVALGEELLSWAPRSPGSLGGDVIPISLLEILSEIGTDYHDYLVRNHQAIKEHEGRVEVSLGLGAEWLPVQSESEMRRISLGRELAGLSPPLRQVVRGVLEPVHVWHALSLPPALAELDPADPRCL